MPEVSLKTTLWRAERAIEGAEARNKVGLSLDTQTRAGKRCLRAWGAGARPRSCETVLPSILQECAQLAGPRASESTIFFGATKFSTTIREIPGSKAQKSWFQISLFIVRRFFILEPVSEFVCLLSFFLLQVSRKNP